MKWKLLEKHGRHYIDLPESGLVVTLSADVDKTPEKETLQHIVTCVNELDGLNPEKIGELIGSTRKLTSAVRHLLAVAVGGEYHSDLKGLLYDDLIEVEQALKAVKAVECPQPTESGLDKLAKDVLDSEDER